MKKEWIIGLDVGGTFTDAIAHRADGEVRVAKVPTRPDDPAGAFAEAVEELAAVGVDPRGSRLVFYGTTIATNALLTGALARVVLVCTAGFRDLLTYRDGRRDHIYDLAELPHPEWVSEDDRVEVAERLSWDGKAIEPLTDDEIRRVVAEVERRSPDAVAIATLFSYVDDEHECRLAEAIEKRLGPLPVATSSSVAREFREYPRTATAVLNAGLRPVVDKALHDVHTTLSSLGISAPLLVMQSNGGCVPADRASADAHRLVLSGPAGGVAGAVALGAQYGLDRLISLDMGGTSLDVCLIGDGTVPVRPLRKIDGFQVLCPAVDVVAVGAGGGSIAWSDRSQRLHVGPDSAGAVPGPAAYGRGGERATVTDAHVVAGTLPADLVLAGSLRLDRDAARDALRPLARQVGLEVAQLATGVVAVAVSQMVAAVRRVSVEQGLDPREYTLVVFGGAGPLHAGLLLREVGARSVLIPRFPGLFAASGLVASDLRIDRSQTILSPFNEQTLHEMASWFSSTAESLRETLKEDGLAIRRVRLLASADCRFVGQGFELNVPLGGLSRRSLADTRARFCRLHLANYGHADESQQVEVVNLRLSAFGPLGTPDAPPLAEGRTRPPSRAVIGQALADLPDGRGPRRLPILERTSLLSGNVVAGPVIVHQLDSTILVLPGQSARVDSVGSIWIEERTRNGGRVDGR